MEPLKMLFHMAAAAVLGVAVDHRGLRGPLPGPVIHGIAPQAADPRSPSRAIQYRQRRVVAEHFRRRHHRLHQQRMQRLQPPRRPLDPAHQRGPVEIDAVSRQHLRLPVQWQVPGEL